MKAVAKNLVLVSYDSVRRDVAFSGKLPALERLRRHGTSFLSCVSSAPLTPVSHATVLTGLQPYHHGIRHLFKEPLRPVPTLAARLKQAGFRTSAVVSCPGLHRWYGMCDGFDQYDDEVPRLPDGTDPLETVDVKLRGRALKRAPLAIERSLEQLAGIRPEPFFHFLHFFDAHWPYEAPELVPGERGANPYEEEVRYLDHHFGRWLERMEDGRRLQDTLIVLFADHGEDLQGWYENDRGGSDGDHPEEMGHGCLLHDPTIMVPLVFSAPGLPRREVPAQVRLVDITPTCLELLGLPAAEKLDGVSLAPAIVGGEPPPDLAAYSETHYPREQVAATGGKYEWTRNKKSVRFGNRFKAIFHLESDVVEAYDLESDPGERKDLLARADRPREVKP